MDAHPLAAVVPVVRELLGEVAQDARHLAVLADADGLLLWSEGHPSMAEAAAKPHFMPGWLCSERGIGTNGIGTALALDHAVQVFSAERFNRLLHGWGTWAAPIRDPETNELLGAVGLSGSFRRAHPHTLALVSAAAQLAEAHLAERQAVDDHALEARYLDLVARSRPRRSALVKRNGRVLASTPPGWLGERLELPASTGEVTLKAARGWPSRRWRQTQASFGTPAPRKARRTRASISARSDATTSRSSSSGAASSSAGATANWSCSSRSTRGMNGEELARALYGVHGSEVTVRAEIARLRRRLGPLVASQPYRLVADVHADFLEVEWMARRGALAAARDLYLGPLLPDSDVAAIAAARAQLERACPRRPWRHDGRARAQPPCNPGSAPERPSRPVTCSPRDARDKGGDAPDGN